MIRRKQMIEKFINCIGYDPFYRVYFIDRCLFGIRVKKTAFTKQEIMSRIKKVVNRRYYSY